MSVIVQWPGWTETYTDEEWAEFEARHQPIRDWINQHMKEEA